MDKFNSFISFFSREKHTKVGRAHEPRRLLGSNFADNYVLVMFMGCDIKGDDPSFSWKVEFQDEVFLTKVGRARADERRRKWRRQRK
jgi:hypothetical protein